MGKYDGLNDRELISLLQQGDEGVLRTIYDTHIRQLHYFILRTAKSRQLAEDVVQDVFIKIWENRMQIDGEQPLKPYLYTIAKRHLLNLLKRVQHEAYIVEEIRKNTTLVENTTEMVIDFHESNSVITEAIDKLPSQCKEVFLRCKIKGLSYQQTADELGISEGTVNSQMVKALKSIRMHVKLKNTLGAILLVLNYMSENQ